MPPKASTSAPAAAAASKKLSPVERKLLEVGDRATKGEISQHDLFTTAGVTINAASQDAVNSLLRKNLVQMLKSTDGTILFRFIKKEEAKAMGTMDADEKLVLEHIKDAKNQGIWTKFLTRDTGLPRAAITKALKVLEGRKAIKAVKSVKHPTRKIYMAAGVTPSVELTGGPWFTDNELDTELVDQLKKIALSYLRTKSIPSSIQISNATGTGTQKFRPIYPVSATPFLPTVQDVLDYIISLEVAVVELLPEHVEALLDLMVYDGDVEKVFVRRDGDEDFAALEAKANDKIKGKGGAKNGKGKGKAASGKGKRKAKADSSDESSSEDDSGSDVGGKRKKKGKNGSSKRATNGKAKRKRQKREDSDEEEEDELSSDFDTDDESSKKKSKGKKKKGADSDDLDEEDSDDSDAGGKKKGSSSRRKRRDRTKKKVKRSSSDDEASGSDSDDGGANGTKKGANGDADEDAAANGGGAAAAGASQYVYRLIRPYRPVIGWTDMPCGRCPVEEFCAEPPRMRAVAYKRPAQVAANPTNPANVLPSVGTWEPTMRIELEGGIQGVGMLGGAGAAIGVSSAKWGEMKGAVGEGVAPINPKDCPAFAQWLTF
ncbi:hypothetical protein JCM8547_006018 [Rhodosporidiobolus lusitaniae]